MTDTERESLARTIACSFCGVPAGQSCHIITYPYTIKEWAHLTRAAEARALRVDSSLGGWGKPRVNRTIETEVEVRWPGGLADVFPDIHQAREFVSRFPVEDGTQPEFVERRTETTTNVRHRKVP